MEVLDKTGLGLVWNKIKEFFISKSGGTITGPITISNPENPSEYVKISHDKIIGSEIVDESEDITFSLGRGNSGLFIKGSDPRDGVTITGQSIKFDAGGELNLNDFSQLKTLIDNNDSDLSNLVIDTAIDIEKINELI